MPTQTLLDASGRRRSPATMPGYLCGRAPKNKGMRYPADPPRPEEIIAVMRAAGANAHGLRVRALGAVLWRAGLRISEALAVTETEVDPRRGSVLVRHGKGDKRREAGMDDRGFEHVGAWLERRLELPVGPIFCVIDGPTKGRRPWSSTSVPNRTSWEQREDWRRAGEQILDARKELGIERSGLGPLEERLARVEGLLPEQDRAQHLDRGHGWEL